MTYYRYWSIDHPDHPRDLQKALRNIGFYTDGRLYNPGGYPEELVERIIRPLYVEWVAERAAKRKRGAAKAAITRQRRTKERIHGIAARMLRDEKIGPSSRCEICGRTLADDVSIARGVGSECWQTILAEVEALRARKRGGAA